MYKILMYKIKNGLCSDYISRLFIIRSNQYNLRNNDFIIPKVNTTGYGKHSVRYLGPVLWSKIDRKIRELKTLDEFKRKITKADLAKYILRNNCIYYPTALRRVQITLKRVQISRGICTPEDRLDRFPAVDQSVSWISRANFVPLRILLSRIPL